MSEGPCSVELTSRQVIERKLLTALEDDNVVAALLSRQDLEDLLLALECNSLAGPRRVRCKALEAGLRQLFREAFQA